MILHLDHIDFLTTDKEMMNKTLDTWLDDPDYDSIPVRVTEWNNRKVDPIPGIFQQIAVIAQAASQPGSSTSAADPPADSDSGSSEEPPSESESEGSTEVGMGETLVLDADTGGATFHSS